MVEAGPGLQIHPEKCTGCRQCELACSFVQTGSFQPSRSVIRVHVFDEQASFAPYTCFQCAEAWCMQACPVNAIDVDEASGAKIVLDAVCVGCKLCTIACPFGTIFYDTNDDVAAKCDLCAGDPACAHACPTGAIETTPGEPGGWIGPFGERIDADYRLAIAEGETVSTGIQGGWTGKLLRVDLGAGTVRSEKLDPQWAREYVGGRGLGARILADELDPRVDPLSPENLLVFATGPLTGTNASCGARYMVVTKGPLTGAITTSNSGGRWGPELKFAGWDALVLEGRAEHPVWLWIHDDHVELRSAEHLWGVGVFETEDRLRAETGMPDCAVAAIGPAGENRVLYAAIVNEKFRAAGRSGVGAVMGSKNLKAIAVRGTGPVRVADPAAMMAAQWAQKQALREAPLTSEGLPNYGTLALMNVINEHGALPTRNYRQAQFEGAERISGEELAATRLLANKACFACTIACGRVSRISDEGVGRYTLDTSPRNWHHATEGPEYENAWSLGADCGVDDLDAILKANTICNDLGMDPISLGATIAAAMELFEDGVISEADAGMPLPFGSGDALVALAEATAWRRGLGNLLAEGSKRLGESLGRPDVFMGVKGQEFPAYDPRALQGMGLGYATSNRGACHLRAYTVAAEVVGEPEPMDPRATDGKARLTIDMQNVSTAVDATGLCLFLTFGNTLSDLTPLLAAATGFDYDDEELTRAGERIWNLERVWNMRAGIDASEDKLPKRMLAEPIPAGPARGEVNRLGEMLPEYYRLRGWSADGRPEAETLAALGIR